VESIERHGLPAGSHALDPERLATHRGLEDRFPGFQPPVRSRGHVDRTAPRLKLLGQPLVARRELGPCGAGRENDAFKRGLSREPRRLARDGAASDRQRRACGGRGMCSGLPHLSHAVLILAVIAPLPMAFGGFAFRPHDSRSSVRGWQCPPFSRAGFASFMRVDLASGSALISKVVADQVRDGTLPTTTTSDLDCERKVWAISVRQGCCPGPLAREMDRSKP
jgi:hypothetical protein